MKIVALSHFDSNFEKLKDIVVPHNLQYYSKHKIEFVYFNGGFDDLISDSCDGIYRNYWTKLFFLYNCFEAKKHADWFFVIDADAIFCDFNIDLRHIITMSDKHKELIACCLDSSSENSYWNINAGALLVKNTDYMKNVIYQILYIGEKLNFNSYEEVVLQNILRKNMFNIREKTEIFPSRAFNHGDENSFIYHACDLSTSNQDPMFAIKNKEEKLSRVIDIIRKKNEDTVCSTL